MSDKRLDQAIDDVARELTRGEPGGAFRAQVMARIDAGATPRARWRAAWILSPLAVAALVMIAVFVARGPDSPVRLKPDTTVAVAPQSRVVPLAPTHEAASAPQETAPSPRTINVRLPPSPRRGFGGTGKPDTTPAPQIDPLVEPRLDVALLTIDALTPDPISVDRLDAVPSIAIAPLDINDLQRRFE
jgi:hypothetical protein